MKRLIIIISFIMLLFSACSVTKQQSSITGQFKGLVLSGDMILSLKPDRTFDLHWCNVNYTGKWEVLDKNRLLLKFDEITNTSILLSSNVILDREREIKFVNKNKIKMKGHVIKKVNIIKAGYNVLKREKK